ncbi:hypothetical protein V8C44DRAFT_314467 [Trichoderma aethiopicum]
MSGPPYCEFFLFFSFQAAAFGLWLALESKANARAGGYGEQLTVYPPPSSGECLNFGTSTAGPHSPHTQTLLCQRVRV